jgi:hypothetical protein
MECIVFLILLVVLGVVAGVIAAMAEHAKMSQMSGKERKEYVLSEQWGKINPAMVCPHCLEKGSVRTKPVIVKKGISGDKAAAAVVTGGLSILATGLSRKEQRTQARCDNCENTWEF